MRALNERGTVLFGAIEKILDVTRYGDTLSGAVPEPTERVPEELRSRQPSMFSVIRGLVELFASPGANPENSSSPLTPMASHPL